MTLSKAMTSDRIRPVSEEHRPAACLSHKPEAATEQRLPSIIDMTTVVKGAAPKMNSVVIVVIDIANDDMRSYSPL
ncbi:unnamed protein product [Macrosiphum euphorbiae]|uniref:Uncharacterized protein n=1 Tax=Macrosiphum euphorbiae TaxID=13131 RepID=A0AAV0VYB1_9HEMI|nr:unnamed protein product [Macrosiphum euphorbiae]